MASSFLPRLDVLPKPQSKLWDELSAVPSEFVLYDGTAIALHLGHRQSLDFDFFGSRPIDPLGLPRGIPFMAGARITKRDENSVTGIVDRGGPVQVSFFGVPRLRRLLPPLEAADNGLKVAALLDLAGTKTSVVQVRAEAKDYIDLDALMTRGRIDLARALAAGQALYGETFNPQITLKALSYFEDGNLGQLPDEVKKRLASAARAVDLDRLPDIERSGQ